MSKFILPTFTGKLFNLASPIEDMICIEDIAHHLSIENRFNGATKFAYSVAYHSLLVCQFAPEKYKLEALLHDAAEAYCKDLTSPLKQLFRYKCAISPSCYYSIDNKIEELIISKFKLLTSSYEESEANVVIKQIDLKMANTEIAQLLWYFPKENWAHDYIKVGEGVYNIEIMKLQPENVEELFLKEYEKWRRD